MILDHVPDDTGFFVELATSLHAEALSHRDLDILDVVPIPDRLEKRVREPEVEDVLDSFLPQVMIDAEDGVLVEELAKDPVQLLRRRHIASERLLDNDASVRRAVRLRELTDDAWEHARRDREVVDGPWAVGELSAQPDKCVGVVVVAVDVPQLLHERRERL